MHIPIEFIYCAIVILVLIIIVLLGLLKKAKDSDKENFRLMICYRDDSKKEIATRNAVRSGLEILYKSKLPADPHVMQAMYHNLEGAASYASAYVKTKGILNEEAK